MQRTIEEILTETSVTDKVSSVSPLDTELLNLLIWKRNEAELRGRISGALGTWGSIFPLRCLCSEIFLVCILAIGLKVLGIYGGVHDLFLSFITFNLIITLVFNKVIPRVCTYGGLYELLYIQSPLQNSVPRPSKLSWLVEILHPTMTLRQIIGYSLFIGNANNGEWGSEYLMPHFLVYLHRKY